MSDAFGCGGALLAKLRHGALVASPPREWRGREALPPPRLGQSRACRCSSSCDHTLELYGYVLGMDTATGAGWSGTSSALTGGGHR